MLFAVVLCLGPVGLAEPVGTAFTYQGRLIDANKAADGLYDFQFKLFDANSAGNQLGTDINKLEVDVIDGYFTVELDFGSVFNGNNRWLEIGVRPGVQSDPCAYSLLSPRQKITPTPYALHIRGILVDDSNTFVGFGAGAVNRGIYNTFSGVEAGYSNTTGFDNTFSGVCAGLNNTTGFNNTFSGVEAGYNNTTGSDNTFSGHYAGATNTTGYDNTFSGANAGYSNTSGIFNTFSGDEAGYYNTTGSDNTFSGYYAGASNTTGYGNTFSGYVAGLSNSTGHDNTFSGANAGLNNTGSGNVFLGYKAGYNETGSNKLNIANSDVNNLIYGDFSAKNVGINTTTPARNLHVNDVMRLQPRSTAPASPAEGDIYMNSTTHKLLVYDGTAWQACW